MLCSFEHLGRDDPCKAVPNASCVFPLCQPCVRSHTEPALSLSDLAALLLRDRREPLSGVLLLGDGLMPCCLTMISGLSNENLFSRADAHRARLTWILFIAICLALWHWRPALMTEIDHVHQHSRNVQDCTMRAEGCGGQGKCSESTLGQHLASRASFKQI